VDLSKSAARKMRVALGRRKGGMPEQFLDDAEIGPALEQVGGERVPQGVRRDVPYAGSERDPFDDGARITGSERAAAVTTQHYCISLCVTRRTSRRLRTILSAGPSE